MLFVFNISSANKWEVSKVWLYAYWILITKFIRPLTYPSSMFCHFLCIFLSELWVNQQFFYVDSLSKLLGDSWMVNTAGSSERSNLETIAIPLLYSFLDPCSFHLQFFEALFQSGHHFRNFHKTSHILMLLSLFFEFFRNHNYYSLHHIVFSESGEMRAFCRSSSFPLI